MKRASETKLKSKEDFEYLRLESTGSSSKYLKAYYKKSRLNFKNSRLGMSVSKKVGNAVKRNYCKRLLREFFYNSKLKESSMDILFVVFPKLYSNHKDEDIHIELKKSFEKIERYILSTNH